MFETVSYHVATIWTAQSINKNKHSVNDVHDFSFPFFCLIHSFHIFITVVYIHNILWCDESRTIKLTQRLLQYFYLLFTSLTSLLYHCFVHKSVGYFIY